MLKVPKRTPEEIEQDAEMLLADYAETVGSAVEAAVPVEDIARYHLALHVEFADMHETLGVPLRGSAPDILGAIFLEKRAILIDCSLDPESNPSQLGRYRFSLAHEVGHWRLHSAFIAKKKGLRIDVPSFICRQSESQIAPIEQQADSYASCLLIPRKLAREAWGQLTGRVSPFSFEVWEHGSDELHRLWRGLKVDGGSARSLYARECERTFEEVALPLAQHFQVSNQAMRIRLERLGLLFRIRRHSQGERAKA
jgi:Zn-dependent peptidase ImmA (M78 family)